jgi:hypothetical protein
MRFTILGCAIGLALTMGESGAALNPAPLVFPIPDGACRIYPCAIDPYPPGTLAVTPSMAVQIPAGAAMFGAIQTQMLDAPAPSATVLYSAYNRDKSYLQTLWISVMPSRGGYHVVLNTCRGNDYPATPCKV